MLIKKYIYILLGLLSLGIGFIGIFLPLLPTTPFLLLTAYLFSKSNKKLYYWMHHNPYFGEYLTKYEEGKGIPLKTKILALTMLWVSIIYSAIILLPYYLVSIALILLAAYISYHILRQPTYKKEN